MNVSSLDGQQYLSFAVGAEEYALSVLRVKEIIEFGGVTRVPSTPAYIRGVINLRGSVVPVIDLATKFGQPASRVSPRSCIVLVETAVAEQSTVVGIMVDSVSQVVELAEHDVIPPPRFGASVRVDYLVGLGRVAGKLVLVIDVDRVLAAEELLELVIMADAEAAMAEM
ncbi:MAG TPA: chemotaxis protein CheW [Thermoanaerobaculia bacterium]|jgi:purine-binding chemotaxis protein CheW